jgi:hypothetical protein
MNNFVFSSPTSTPLDLFLLPVASGLKRLLHPHGPRLQRKTNLHSSFGTFIQRSGCDPFITAILDAELAVPCQRSRGEQRVHSLTWRHKPFIIFPATPVPRFSTKPCTFKLLTPSSLSPSLSTDCEHCIPNLLRCQHFCEDEECVQMSLCWRTLVLSLVE